MKRVVGAALGLYLFYAVLASLYVPLAIYPFDDRPFTDPAYRAVAAGNATVHVAEAAPGAPVVVYFMGNAGALQYFSPMLDHHRAAGRSVVALAYPGGGGLPGRPTEDRLKALALDAVDHGLPHGHGPVIVHGYSLGTGLALHVAARRKVAAVILSAPYARLCDLMARQSALPACRMPWIDRWQSLVDVPQVVEPVLILHGTADTLIPVTEAERLRDAFHEDGHDRVRYVPLTDAGHSNLMSAPDYLPQIDRFISGYRP